LHAWVNALAHSKNTKDKIADAALDVFASKGFKASTTREIAMKAGVNEVTIFRLFKTKERLFNAAAERIGQIPMNMVSGTPEPSDDIVADLTDMGMFITIGVTENSKYFKLMISEVTRRPKLWEKVSPAPMFVVSLLTGYFDKAKARGLVRKDLDTLVAAVGFFSFFFRTLVTTAFLGKDVFIDMNQENIHKFAELFVKGIE
jgi:AcrR family transcriptional regulator